MKNICKIKIFYDSNYFDEVAEEFQKCIHENLQIQIHIIHILDSEDEKRQWNETLYFCFGMHKWMDMRNIPPYFVLMQLEPLIVRGLPNERYLILLKKSCGIFEYSRLNLNFYKEFNISKNKIYLFEIGIGSLESKDSMANTNNEETISTNVIQSQSILLPHSKGSMINEQNHGNPRDNHSSNNKVENVIDDILMNDKISENKKENSKDNCIKDNCLKNDCIKDNCIKDNCIKDNCIKDNCIKDNCIKDNCIKDNCMKDIDILFIGNMTEHRTIFMQKLKKKFFQKNIQTFDNLWGKTRDMIMKRSKIVLNIHSENYSKFPLETPRLLYSSKFQIHIVSESCGDITEESRWNNRVNFINNTETDFVVIEKLLENDISKYAKIINKQKKKAPKMDQKMNDFFGKNNFNIETLQSKVASSNAQKWFDPDYNCNLFQKLELECSNMPNISTYDLNLLPNVSVITLTTQERIHKWKNLMKWNNDNRVYNSNKIEWIIVIDKPLKGTNQEIFFENIKIEMKEWKIKPTWLIYENTKQDIPNQITEKRNLAVEISKYDYIDCMDDDDIEIPDGLKIKMISLVCNDKKCAGSSSLMCLDLKKKNIFVKKAFFPTESSLTFHKSFWKTTRFNPNIHGECFTMIMSQTNEIIDVPSSLNLIAITHNSNITGLSRTCTINSINSCSDSNMLIKNLKNFLGQSLTLDLIDTIF